MDISDVLLLTTLILTSASAQDSSSCTTPNSEQGECIDLKKCPDLLSMLTKLRPLPPEVVNFLQRSQCGFNGKSPLVCCPLSATTTTPAPTTPGREPAEEVSPVFNHRNMMLLPLNICGPVSENKIINGNKTALFQYPWMALIAYNRAGSSTRVFHCGGTVINEKYVLTAAHCITELPDSMKLAGVRLGEHNMDTDIDCTEDEEEGEVCAEPHVDFDIEESIAHPNYSTSHLQNDIALIRIKGIANLRSDSIKPICLPLGADQTRKLDGQNLIVSGWGATEKGISSSILLQVAVPVISQEQCAGIYDSRSASYKRRIRITSNQICAGGVNAQDSCDGDSGGPLIFKGEVKLRPRFVQYGIVSFGPRSCGIKGFPAVYTKVASYVDWILSSMRP
ncbi:Serine protease easter [Zootermopsis nevadensis]|uniref:CLIP domain-containing serine protease n=1 Tax=Zootermopsis nevadensis TaxID=136037 RepID=A0A067QFH0_ZOONE|nr:Serine protease easter [Zootermopsis nevadensis]